MASTMAHRAQVIRIAHAQPANIFRRNFTRSASALKKRRAIATDAEDLFSDENDGDELFSSLSASSSKNTLSTSAFTNPQPKAAVHEPTVASPFKLFNEQHTFISARVGPKPAESHPLVRHRALRRLLHHAQGPEHLDRIVEVLEKWRKDGRAIDRKTTIGIIDRCLLWNPPLILTLFADKAKYGLTLPNVSFARRILHRLIFFRPTSVAQSADKAVLRKANAEALRNAVTFSALLPSHGLKKATEDTMCCALLAQACARNLTRASTEGEGRAQLRVASIRGLASISATLASLLSRPNTPMGVVLLPSPESIKGDQLVFQRREAGQTQTGVQEGVWVHGAVRDVVHALKKSEGMGTTATSKESLKVLEKALGAS